MKNTLEFNTELNTQKRNNFFPSFITWIYEFVSYTIGAIISFWMLSCFSLLFTFQKEEIAESLGKSFWEKSKEFSKFIFNLIQNPLSQDFSGKNLGFLIASSFSLFVILLFAPSLAFIRGFRNGSKNVAKHAMLEKKRDLSEKTFIEDKLMKIIEDVQNRIIRLQYDIIESSRKIDKMASDQVYEEFEKVQNSDPYQVRRKVDELESLLKKMNKNVLLGGQWKVTTPRRRINYTKNSEAERKDELERNEGSES